MARTSTRPKRRPPKKGGAATKPRRGGGASAKAKAARSRPSGKPAGRKPSNGRRSSRPSPSAAPRRPVLRLVTSHPELDDDAPPDEVREIFRTYDRDGSGSIDASELASLLEALGAPPSEEELRVALEAVDRNGSGVVSWAEFKAWWNAR